MKQPDQPAPGRRDGLRPIILASTVIGGLIGVVLGYVFWGLAAGMLLGVGIEAARDRTP